MIEVKRLLLKKEYFKGDAYFYVDDSVIYIQAELNEELFIEKIHQLNKELQEWCNEKEKGAITIDKYIGKAYLEFHKKLNYCIQFHEDGKSVFTHIDDADNMYGPIATLPRETSLHSKIAYNLDEIDDRVSLKKLEELDKVISREIEDLTQKQSNKEINANRGKDLSSRLKMLRRFKKFFLYRNRLLKIRKEGGPTDNMINDFRSRFLEKATKAEDFL